MDPSEFRRHGHALVEWIADYLSNSERYPVLARVAPGEVRDALPDAAPERGEPFEEILNDFERVLVPALTHWNHPGFFAYFPCHDERIRSARGVSLRSAQSERDAVENLASAHRARRGFALVAAAAAWSSRRVRGCHLRHRIDLEPAWLAAARQAAVPNVREHGLAARSDVGPLRVYCSEQAHSSIDKAVVTLGFGHSALRKIPVDAAFSMRADALRAAIEQDRREGVTPVAVVATIGTTSTTGVDPVAAIADICRDHGYGCTSMRRMRASPRCFRNVRLTSADGIAPIRLSSILTSGSSRHSTSARSIAVA
jgi:aromatic-L-amino-acid decarboxylase